MKRSKFNKDGSRLSTTQSKIIAVLNLLALIVSIVSFASVLELTYKNIGWGGWIIFLPFALLGCICAFYFSRYLVKFFPFLKEEIEKEKSSVGSSVYFGFIFLTPALAHLYNRSPENLVISCEKYRINEKGESTYRGHTYYLYVDYKGSREQLYTSKEDWDRLNRGDKIEVCTAKGKLNVDFLYDVKPIKG